LGTGDQIDLVRHAGTLAEAGRVDERQITERLDSRGLEIARPFA
jgi:hypothetical protein